MDTIARIPRLPYSQTPGNAASNLAKQPLKATAPATRADVRSHNIFQRTLLWIKGWVQSRVKAASVNRALSPFVKAAKPDSTGLITDAHFKKLKSALALVCLLVASSAVAGERYALIVTGASAGEPYTAKYAKWRDSLLSTLRERFGYTQDRLFVLSEEESNGARKATLKTSRKPTTRAKTKFKITRILPIVFMTNPPNCVHSPRGLLAGPRSTHKQTRRGV